MVMFWPLLAAEADSHESTTLFCDPVFCRILVEMQMRIHKVWNMYAALERTTNCGKSVERERDWRDCPPCNTLCRGVDDAQAPGDAGGEAPVQAARVRT